MSTTIHRMYRAFRLATRKQRHRRDTVELYALASAMLEELDSKDARPRRRSMAMDPDLAASRAHCPGPPCPTLRRLPRRVHCERVARPGI